MPKTTVQKVIFGLLMSFFMVLAMEMYNTGLRNGGLTTVSYTHLTLPTILRG